MTSTDAPPAIPSAPVPAPPVLAEVVRSGFTEGHHRGALVLLAADGSVERAIGDPAAPVFPRSSNKPMQAAAILRAGLDLSGERLALAAASHSGEPFHLDLARKMLAEHGLKPADLQTPPDLPLDPVEAETYLAAGNVRERITMNCSGKHAAMLAVCVRNGWDTATYLDPAHPLQRLVGQVVAEAAGEPVAAVGTDGCGAPLMAIGLTGLARAFRSFVLAEPGSAERRVADAMRAHPEYVAGTRRPDTWLMREVPGTLSKMGAEAVQAVALADGRALAFKIDDGAGRALGPVLARALELLGVDAPVVARIGRSPLLGGAAEVGEIRATF
ncbi:asparaginase [Streptomyces filamentosus]|uniref:Asparaginase n=2 Tax=Streptomyces filamentosus TaxID=67294 RepID=A0ABY4V0H1_STRFL|nr:MULTISPECIES: asparaginase [Streptomyces]EFE75680.1 L-asparaginase II [Streptomyces filamentosus NRRL 15998]ESU49274.1 putative L-asparaginase II [Streptomyces sp. HCCB10043]EWS92703.1 L-asparaginase II [Streptomyces filamentosus NRRL 11379]MYR79729.1 asparaginase [Streptomyces sp. SID5466]USC48717.1 asparaginase [Streptomyces filamentosus]